MKVVFCYSKNPKCPHGRHSGIGISCLSTAKTLMQHGYQAEVWPITGGDELWFLLSKHKGVTHIVIAAFFIPTDYLAKLAFAFPDIKFAVNSHSNVGFLQAEPEAITKFRETVSLQVESRNVFASGNSQNFVHAMRVSFGHCLLLPNLYFLHGHEGTLKPLWNGGVLRLGCFGALRVQKNISTAVVAAIEIARQLKAITQIWINVGRDDNTGDVVIRAARAWTNDLPGITLNELPWQNWAEFRKTASTMHCLIQPSYSETFSQVSADACAEGVPTISGDAIEWLPSQWKANTDDPSSIAQAVRFVLADHHASALGLQSLKSRNNVSLGFWKEFLT
jgi:hypothetical protein